MSTTTLKSKRFSMLAVLGMAGLSAACSTVSPEEMDTSLQELRADMMAEMRAGDEAISDRVAAVERRMAALEADLQLPIVLGLIEVPLRLRDETVRANRPLLVPADQDGHLSFPGRLNLSRAVAFEALATGRRSG